MECGRLKDHDLIHHEAFKDSPQQDQKRNLQTRWGCRKYRASPQARVLEEARVKMDCGRLKDHDLIHHEALRLASKGSKVGPSDAVGK
jgi:hypothetical protein